MNYKDLAFKYLDVGILTLPVKPGNKWPALNDWTEKLNEQYVEEMVDRYPNYGICLPTGKFSNIIAIDIDVIDQDSLDRIVAVLPFSPCHKKGLKGRTYLYRVKEDFEKLQIKGIIEILSTGQQTVIPPTIYPGKTFSYEWTGEPLLECYDELPFLSRSQCFDIIKKVQGLFSDTNSKSFFSEGRNSHLITVGNAKAFEGCLNIEQLASELINYDKNNHSTPWFSDVTEPHGGKNPLSEAKKMAKRIITRVEKELLKTPDELTITRALDMIGVSKSKSGIPFSNIDNVTRIFEQDDRFKNMFWYDNFYQRYYTNWCGETREWSEKDDLKLTVMFQRDLGFHKISDDIVSKAVINYASNNKKNEPQDWVKSLSWDNESRIESFFFLALGAEDNEYIRSVSKNFWIAIVSRLFNPGCKFDNMTIFEGAQGSFKSTALSIIGGKWYVDCNEKIDSKDFYMVLKSKLIVEISELDSLYKSDVNMFKKMLSCRVDRYRPPYGKYEQDFPRQCVFVGTTNDHKYLKDDTGARRFWPVKTNNISLEYIEKHRDQLFAEAYQFYLKKELFYEVPLGQALEQQEHRRQYDPWLETIQDYLAGKVSTTIYDIASRCLEIPNDRHDQKSSTRISRILRQLGYAQKVSKVEGKTRRLYYLGQ